LSVGLVCRVKTNNPTLKTGARNDTPHDTANEIHTGGDVLCGVVRAVCPRPAHAGAKQDKQAQKQAEQIEKMRQLALREKAEYVARNIRDLREKTHDLKRQIRKENIAKKDTVGKYTKRVDDEYLDRLKDIANTGNKEVWYKVRAEYKAARKNAMAKDKKRAEEKNRKTPNPYLKPLSDPWDRYK